MSDIFRSKLKTSNYLSVFQIESYKRYYCFGIGFNSYDCFNPTRNTLKTIGIFDIHIFNIVIYIRFPVFIRTGKHALDKINKMESGNI